MVDLIAYPHSWKNGTLEELDIVKIWRQLTSESQISMLRLLSKFSLLWRVSDDEEDQVGSIIVPSMLYEYAPLEMTKIKVAELEPNGAEYRRVYMFDFVPLGFFSTLLGRLNTHAGWKCTHNWRDGVIIEQTNGDCKQVAVVELKLTKPVMELNDNFEFRRTKPLEELNPTVTRECMFTIFSDKQLCGSFDDRLKKTRYNSVWELWKALRELQNNSKGFQSMKGVSEKLKNLDRKFFGAKKQEELSVGAMVSKRWKNILQEDQKLQDVVQIRSIVHDLCGELEKLLSNETSYFVREQQKLKGKQSTSTFDGQIKASAQAITIYVRSPDESSLPLDVPFLMNQVVKEIETHIQSNYHHLGTFRGIPCTHCIGSYDRELINSMEYDASVTVFDFKECCATITEKGEQFVYCCETESKNNASKVSEWSLPEDHIPKENTFHNWLAKSKATTLHLKGKKPLLSFVIAPDILQSQLPCFELSKYVEDQSQVQVDCGLGLVLSAKRKVQEVAKVHNYNPPVKVFLNTKEISINTPTKEKAATPSSVRMSLQFSSGDLPVVNPKDKKEKKKKKKPLKEAGGDISTPYNLKHVMWIDEELSWSGQESTKMFQVQKKIGEGAFGSVYLVSYMNSNKNLFAVKELSAGADEAEDIKKEVDILKKCKHNSIVSYFGTVTKDPEHIWV